MMGHLRLTLAGAMICAACLATCPLGAQTQQLVESCGKGELDQNNSRVYLKRGVANIYLGAIQKAAADLNRASELDRRVRIRRFGSKY
jgi:hypothetical protein